MTTASTVPQAGGLTREVRMRSTPLHAWHGQEFYVRGVQKQYANRRRATEKLSLDSLSILQTGHLQGGSASVQSELLGHQNHREQWEAVGSEPTNLDPFAYLVASGS